VTKVVNYISPQSWGTGPVSVVGVIVIILVVLLVMGRL
jgi:hypothetical protein